MLVRIGDEKASLKSLSSYKEKAYHKVSEVKNKTSQINKKMIEHIR